MAKVVKTVKNMDQKIWNEIKAEANEHNMTMPEFLKILIHEHKAREVKKKVLKSMFGAHPDLTPFVREHDDHEF